MGEAIKRINIRCSEEEYDSIQQAADKSNLTVTAYLIRSAVAIAQGKGEIKTEPKPRQEWAGSFDEAEIEKMISYLCNTYGMMSRHRAEYVARLWKTALETVQDAEAQGTQCYPTDGDRDAANGMRRNAAFIQYVRDNPGTPVELWEEVAEAIGVTEFEFSCLRSDLGWDLTQYRGVFDVTYPWRQLG